MGAGVILSRLFREGRFLADPLAEELGPVLEAAAVRHLAPIPGRA